MKIVIYFISVLCIGFLSCSSTQDLKSTRSVGGMTLDGDNNDWDNNSFFDEDNDILLHFENDNEFLYLGFATDDIVKQSQILNMGFIVWFDKNGGTEKKLGIKFPLGMKGNFGFFNKPRQDAPNEEKNLNDEYSLVDSMTTIELVENEKTTGKIRNLSALSGIWLSAKKYKGIYVYELKIALYPKGYDISLGLKPGNAKSIGIGFETVAPDMDKMREKMPKRDDMPPTDMPEGRNKKPGMRPEMNFLKYWVNLKLVN